MNQMKKLCIFKIRYDYLFVFFAFLLFLTVIFFFALPSAQMPANSLSVAFSFAEKTQTLNSWYDAYANQHCLFLPSAALAQSSIHVILPANTILSIAGHTLRNGDILPPDIVIPAEGSLDFHPKRSDPVKSEPVLLMASSELPSIFIETQSGSMERVFQAKTNKEAGKALVLTADGEINYSGDLTHIRGRGNVSWDRLKHPYAIKFPHAVDLFHMGSAEKWILIANGNDFSGMRNHVVYETAKEVGLPYAIEETFVDLYINHEYQGLYLLTEAIEPGESRVDIQDLSANTQAVNPLQLSNYPLVPQEQFQYSDIPNNPKDISGGYLLEMEVPDRYNLESSKFTTSGGKFVVLSSPEYASLAQMQYISDLVQQTEDAILSADGINPFTKKAFTEYIDLSSWVQRLLLDEIFINLDAEATSSFFYKDSDSRSTLLYAGPAWDYDQSLGYTITTNQRRWIQMQNAEAFYATGEVLRNNYWYRSLYKNPVFYQALVTEYQENFLPFLQFLCDERIDSYWDSIHASLVMNNLRWQDYGLPVTLDGQLEQLCEIKDFLAQRIQFLNSVWLEDAEYYTVTINCEPAHPREDSGSTTFWLEPGQTLEDEFSHTVSSLLTYSFYQDRDCTIPFDLQTPITEDQTVYMQGDTYHAVYVDRPLRSSGYFVKSGASFWDEVSKTRYSMRNVKFYLDPYGDIPFDVHAPITEDTTIYMERERTPSAKTNFVLFALVLLLTGFFIIFEWKTKASRLKRGDQYVHGKR